MIPTLYPVATALVYYHRRIRRKGFDIERMMDAAGLNSTGTLPGSKGPMAQAGTEEIRP